MPEIDQNLIKEEIKSALEGALNLDSLQQISRQYIGEQGKITLIFKNLKNLPAEERAVRGKMANDLKKFFEEGFQARWGALKGGVQISKNRIDVSIPAKKVELGHLHPLTLVKRKAEDIFQSMGFQVVEGPEIENEWFNFDALNIPKDHPARDAWDTFWLKTNSKEKKLLRTHTSPVQARFMENKLPGLPKIPNPPFRIIVPGNVFRHEATDTRHEYQITQMEGLMVDKEVSAANFKAIVGEFFRRFFRKDVEFRLKPDFFPFTEPSFDLGMTCVICHGKGCVLCKQAGWLEVAGAGMVHPNVFSASGLDPKEWQGWAFGFGIDRLAMMKYGIDDVRLFRSGDLRFINQFK